MAHFLLQVAYTSEAWANMLKNPQDRIAIVSKFVEHLGGKLEGGWLSFGDHDVVVVVRLPNNVGAAAFSLAVAAGGALKASKTTPLLTFEEGVRAMRQAGRVGYRPPK